MKIIETAALALALVIFVFPIGVSIPSGLNRIAKIGLALVVIGFSAIVIPGYCLYRRDLSIIAGLITPPPDSGETLLNLMDGGLVLLKVGGLLLFIGSCVSTWKNRCDLFPFIFKNQNGMKG